MPNAIHPFAIWQTAYIIFFLAQTRIKKIADKTCAQNPAKNAAK